MINQGIIDMLKDKGYYVKELSTKTSYSPYLYTKDISGRGFYSSEKLAWERCWEYHKDGFDINEEELFVKRVDKDYLILSLEKD